MGDFDRLGFVPERARIGEGKETLLSVKIPEQPGSFNKLYSIIFPRNVTEFSYRYSNDDEAVIYMAFETRSKCRDAKGLEEVEEVVQELSAHNMQALDVTDNEVAKS